MTSFAEQIAKDYSRGELQGWLETRQPGIAKQQFNLLKNSFVPFAIRGQSQATAQKMFLHWITTKAFGCKTAVPDYIPQQTGDCVSFGMKHATEVVSAVEIFQGGQREKWRPIFAPFYYGTGRIYVGHSGGWSAGSLGSWMAEAVRLYGTLFSDENGVPKYSGSVADSWGAAASNGIDKWKTFASSFPVKSMAQINSWDELVAAIANGYPCTTASDVGYAMEASSDGFFSQNDSWSHQMCFIGVDNTYKNGEEPYALILNSWGEDAHGHLKDFETGDPIPGGILRVRRKDAEKHIRAGETYAASNFVGFPEQKLDKSLFKLN